MAENKFLQVRPFYRAGWFYLSILTALFYLLLVFFLGWMAWRTINNFRAKLDTLSSALATTDQTNSALTSTNSSISTDSSTSNTAKVSADDDAYLGPVNAPIEIIVFADFQCPYCRQEFPIIKEVLRLYPDKVKYVFRDFPMSDLHPQAQKASEAAECAKEQGKFWELYDQLFLNQENLGIEDLKFYAQELGLDSEKFNQCLDQGKYQAEVQNDFTAGQALGVTGTPTFFINGQKVPGAIPLKNFKQLIATQLLIKR